MQKNKVHEQLQLIKIIATVLVGPQILHIFSSICGKRVGSDSIISQQLQYPHISTIIFTKSH